VQLSMHYNHPGPYLNSATVLFDMDLYVLFAEQAKADQCLGLNSFRNHLCFLPEKFLFIFWKLTEHNCVFEIPLLQ